MTSMERAVEHDAVSIAAADHFNISYLYPYQRLVITNILEAGGYYGSARTGQSRQIALLPTGSGKSLCYMLPGILLGGVHVLVFPLLSLMEDQRRRLKEAGCRVHVLRGGQKREERTRIFSALREGGTHFLITNPEMLSIPEVRRQLRQLPVNHLVIDEAHTVSEWGDTFRPSLAALAGVIAELDSPLVTACTATASSRILRRLQETLFSGMPAHVIRANPDRPNIRYRVIPSLSPMRDLFDLTGDRGIRRPAVIFCPTRNDARHTAEMLALRHQDCRIRYYHAGLSREEKLEQENWFLSSRDGILCSTIAFGLGIDKGDIRTVIHTQVPETIEAYLQETGRAGRDRADALAIMLVGASDLLKGTSVLVPALLTHTLCRREALLALMDARPETCSGCDVCAGDVWGFAAGEAVIRDAVGSHPYRHDLSAWAQFFCGVSEAPFGSFALWRYRSYGMLSSWLPEEAAEAIRSLVRLSALTCPSRGPWKGKLRSGMSASKAAISLKTWRRLHPNWEAGIHSVPLPEQESRTYCRDV